ncbi:hypothetical protein TNCV_2780651 [Trichonephila clavipes]|nr:hypothetical protein TNCV_2780651 [Trichonephila clavipes]
MSEFCNGLRNSTLAPLISPPSPRILKVPTPISLDILNHRQAAPTTSGRSLKLTQENSNTYMSVDVALLSYVLQAR